ncbi:site-specific DNA-methyltransferase [Ectothiorhodospira shaposhnikovii]|uniref:site-specific DNA-methyltransferase n=1 Tax=Ectothiorhodospira shaposhnikovii TaxID=1054 RepID=UPI001EE8A829|nr:site-specific DNA-methyltransferase [Ectothiorhodospira shaposhnikovii]MCG5512343.1 site-specific DNA-methyltransferase [Ectothiorhodospira shaposhnikovii]
MTDESKTIVSPNPADERRAKLAELIPDAFSEGKLDVAALKRALGESAVIEGGERYALTWAGKAGAYKVLQTPSTSTLRPERVKSVNFDTAQHVFIEGENLEVLKVLQKAYFGKVKLIYIDPPYNTGSDSFIYPDRFQESKEEYLRRINELADDGTLMREGFFRKNSKENGHYHSNWLSMMLPRLYIARNLLREDGVILVSIDDNEAANLKLLMDEVFGSENFITKLVWEKGRKNDAKLVSVGHEYMLIYARSMTKLKENKTVWREPKPGAKEIIEKWRELKAKHGEANYEAQQESLREWYKSLPDSHPSKKLSRHKWVDKWGPWRDRDISWPGGGGPRYDVLHPVTKQPCKVPERGWVYSSVEEMKRQIKLGIVEFRDDHTEPPYRKAHLLPLSYELLEDEGADFDDDEVSDDDIGLQVLGSVIYKQSQVSVKYLRKLMGGKLFNNPKDHEVLARLIRYCMGDDDNGLVLDFFAGSASTVEAVLALNAKEGGNRRVVAVQLPEPCDEKSAAFKAGYPTIAALSRDRINRVIQKLLNEAGLVAPIPADLGFKSFLLAPSNFKQWRGDGLDTPDQLAEQIQLFAKSEKEGAAVEDMLYELLLKFGQELTTPVQALEVNGGKVFAIHERKMLFVLESFSEAMIQPLVELKPREIIAIDGVFLDSDTLKTNLDLQCRDAGIKFTCL